MQTDVLIVGAGPTGLMLANQLARRGVDFLIIDRHAAPTIETRALGVQARTLEIYSHLGIADRAVELGKRATGGNMWIRGKVGAKVTLVAGEELSPYPYILILGQDENERLLGELLGKRGVQVQWNTELTSLQQNADHVIAGLKYADGSAREIRAKWVCGCDGAHSAVRHLNQIGFPGAPYEHVFFVADVIASGPMIPAELNVYLFRQGFHLFFPMREPDHWRVVGILPGPLAERENTTFEDVVPSLVAQVETDIQFQKCKWFSKYKISHRSAERFRDRRCFLLGDAAHIHSPVGAQGMNTGLQDAYNLGWKLALVSGGRANETLLDSYEGERQPVAVSMLKGTDAAFTMIVSDRWIAGILRTHVIYRIASFAMRFDSIRKFAFDTISQTGIRYRQSSLSQMQPGLPSKSPQAGDRFPWLRLHFSSGSLSEDLFQRIDDTRLNLISIGQPKIPDVPREWHDLWKVHEIPADPRNLRELARAHIPNPSFYLLRPDGYIGLAGTRLESSGLIQYGIDHLQLRAQNEDTSKSEKV